MIGFWLPNGKQIAMPLRTKQPCSFGIRNKALVNTSNKYYFGFRISSIKNLLKSKLFSKPFSYYPNRCWKTIILFLILSITAPLNLDLNMSPAIYYWSRVPHIYWCVVRQWLNWLCHHILINAHDHVFITGLPDPDLSLLQAVWYCDDRSIKQHSLTLNSTNSFCVQNVIKKNKIVFLIHWDPKF